MKKAPASKNKVKKSGGKAKGATAVDVPLNTDTTKEIRVQKIANGYLSHESTYGPKGHKTTTTFHEKKPSVNISVETKP